MDPVTKAKTLTMIELDKGVAAILEDCAIAASNMTQAQTITMLTMIATELREKAAARTLSLNG